MSLAVTQFSLIAPYTLRLEFTDGAVKEVDFCAHWAQSSEPIFQPLRDPGFFAQVTLPSDSAAIEWPNGADLAAEFLDEGCAPAPPSRTRRAADAGFNRLLKRPKTCCIRCSTSDSPDACCP